MKNKIRILTIFSSFFASYAAAYYDSVGNAYA